LQIKPVNDVSHIPQIYKERKLQEDTHKQFKEKFGGNVFYIFSVKSGNKKVIQNIEIVEDIKIEISRLENQ
jgi:hypothetical protein